jgi:predicted metal-dependent hydrolase
MPASYPWRMKDNRQPDGSGAAPRALEPEACLRGFRECFNTGRFYEAHDVLEALWLPVRRTAEGELWKGLIQLAAAFVHLQHGRRGPARALLRTARTRLLQAGAGHPLVDLPAAVALADIWEERIEKVADAGLAALLAEGAPRLDPPRAGPHGR